VFWDSCPHLDRSSARRIDGEVHVEDYGIIMRGPHPVYVRDQASQRDGLLDVDDVFICRSRDLHTSRVGGLDCTATTGLNSRTPDRFTRGLRLIGR
jgi:hypothetical protein